MMTQAKVWCFLVCYHKDPGVNSSGSFSLIVSLPSLTYKFSVKWCQFRCSVNELLMYWLLEGK